MELRANYGNHNNFGSTFNQRPSSRNIMTDAPRDPTMQRLTFNIGGKRNSGGGIRDDESILSHTPPNREYATGIDVHGNPDLGTGVKFYQPINFTVNVNNCDQNTALNQPYFGVPKPPAPPVGQNKIDKYNQMMMNILNDLPNP